MFVALTIRMTMQSRLGLTLTGLIGIFLTLASCSPSVPGPQAGGGIGGTGSLTSVASGPITKFGSVFISGTEYDNSNTLYCIDDEPCSTQNTLKIGMVVLVNGRVTDQFLISQPLARVADTITYEEAVEGIVQSVAADGLSLVVLGQVIYVNQATVIDPSVPGQSITNLQPGVDLVEVSGFVAGEGRILATLVMKQTGTPHYEIQGSVKNHDANAKKFEIGALDVDYSSADISDLPSPASASWNGMIVHVRGDQWSQGGLGPNGAKLTATRVKPVGLGVDDSADAEIEGFITQVNLPGDFLVDNLRIQTTGATVFEGGTINDLVLGMHVEIQGTLVQGILQAEHISFEGEIELESNVASIDTGARTLILVGLPGLTVQIDNKTAIGGEGNLQRVEDIAVGDHLKIHGRPAGSTGLSATELERSEPATQIRLQGPVQSALDPLLVVAGATIDTSGIPNNGFTGQDGAVVGRAAFFQGLTVGHKVSLRGTSTGSTATWTNARLNE